MDIDKEDLEAIGSFLYGNLWQSELARDLGINSRTMRRWVSGEGGAKGGVAERLVLLAATDYTEIFYDVLSRTNIKETAIRICDDKSSYGWSKDTDIAIMKAVARRLFGRQITVNLVNL